MFGLAGLLPLCLSAAVSELTDPAYYSAGRMPAEEINRFFAEKLPERNYNLWFGKADRIYLHGAWKFRLIANSARNPKGVRRNLGISRDGVESDYGEQQGFYRADYDDSGWFNQPVPYAWAERFGRYGQVKGASPYVPSKISSSMRAGTGGVSNFRKNGKPARRSCISGELPIRRRYM